MSDQPCPTYTAAKALAADLAEDQLRNNMADMFMTGCKEKAAAVRAAVEADFNRANSPAQREYKTTARVIDGACYDLIEKGCRGWRLTRELRWTKEQPTKTGHYWVKDEKGTRKQQVIVVWQPSGDPTLYAGFAGYAGDPRELSRWTGMLWAGPIPEPIEEKA